jgi:hypothetical protein
LTDLGVSVFTRQTVYDGGDHAVRLEPAALNRTHALSSPSRLLPFDHGKFSVRLRLGTRVQKDPKDSLVFAR